MKTETHGDVLRVTGLDRLTSTNCTYFKEMVKVKLTDQHRVVELDCSTIDFIDSDGIGALVSARKLVALRQGIVRLVGVSPMVWQLCELLKLREIFEINR